MFNCMLPMSPACLLLRHTEEYLAWLPHIMYQPAYHISILYSILARLPAGAF